MRRPNPPEPPSSIPNIEDFCGKPKKKKKAPQIDVERAITQMLGMLSSKDWSTATPLHFVMLYEHKHGEVYGVPPSELAVKKELKLALFAAKRILENEFGGDRAVMLQFMQDLWAQEKRDEKARREGRRQGNFRISWRYQFSPKPVVDMRVARMRKHG